MQHINYYLIDGSHSQWRIYIEATEAVLGAPGLKGPPKLIKINKR